MRVLLLILVPPILLLLFAVLFLWVPLPQPFPPALSDGRSRLSAMVTGVVGIAYLIKLAICIVSSFLQASRVLDPVLGPQGLASESIELFGRRYRGSIEGREVEVTYLPGYGFSRPLLNVYVSADTGTRVAIGPSRPLLDCRECARLDVEEASLSHLEVYAQEEDIARRVLSAPEGRTALGRLLPEQGVPGTRHVYIQPGRVWLRARIRRMTEPQFRQLLDDTLALAPALEAATGDLGP